MTAWRERARNRLSDEPSLLSWSMAVAGLLITLLLLALLSDISAALLLALAFGGAVAMSAGAATQDGRHLRQVSSLRATQEEAASAASALETEVLAQILRETSATRRQTEGRLGEIQYSIEPEIPSLEYEGLALTEKEHTVLAQISEGASIRDIAEQLGVSLATAQKTRRQLELKLTSILFVMRASRGFGREQ